MKDIYEKPIANFIIVKYQNCFFKFGKKNQCLLLDLRHGEKH